MVALTKVIEFPEESFKVVLGTYEAFPAVRGKCLDFQMERSKIFGWIYESSNRVDVINQT